MKNNHHQTRIGVDIGGTFTDIAMEVGGELYSAKVLTDYASVEQAVLDGVTRVVKKAGIGFEDIDMIIHGTTLVTNSLIERRGAKTAFLTTKGFRDVVEMRSESRFEQYDLNIVLPAPLISREHRFVVKERIGSSGKPLEPLAEAEVIRFAQHLVEHSYESLAIGFLHSYINGEHEEKAREIIAKYAPEISISISSEVSPQMRELQRFNTVCANAFVRPLVAKYLNRLVGLLRDFKVSCPIFMIHSGGGLISVATAVKIPVRLLESGPAGGAVYASNIAARYRLNRILSYDMGGTTAKICLIENQTPKTTQVFEVARTYRFKKGSGMSVSTPAIEMIEIGAGGGSIAFVDSMNQIRIGPESAASEPGPACYQRNGERPTVTDADLVLGKIDPENFAGGDIKLSVKAASKAIKKHVGDISKIDETIAATSICEIVDENMANAARTHAVENGKDLTDFTMVAYGGAAPLHALCICQKLGIKKLLIPPGAGVGAAIGFLRTQFAFEAVQGAYMKISQYSSRKVNQILSKLQKQAYETLGLAADEEEIVIERKAFIRYCGQGWEIPLILPDRRFGDDGAKVIHDMFEKEYIRLFGRPIAGLSIEIMNWSVKVAKLSPRIKTNQIVEPQQKTQTSGNRIIFDTKTARFTKAVVVEREKMKEGHYINGPAIITERETTTIVTKSYKAIMQSDGCILLVKKMS